MEKNISISKYLRLSSVGMLPIDEYDDFLLKIWDFFSLRVAAEENYKRNSHVAKSRYGALPISWNSLEEVLKRSGPPEQLITVIAKNNYGDVKTLIENSRKILNRIRKKISIGQVQQLDSHCLRWLTRQPGYTSVEKAGSKQEILGVAREENYNTLENRVLKDFLKRCLAISNIYLRNYKKVFPEHDTIKNVVKFSSLCEYGLRCDKFEKVSEINYLPQPNYVLQQDKLYSKIWLLYCDVLRQEELAEKLWCKKTEICSVYDNVLKSKELNCSSKAKFDTLLWINPITNFDKDIFESPIFDNELGTSIIRKIDTPKEEIVIIDLTNPWDNRDVLSYYKNHINASPFIKNHHQPTKDETDDVNLCDILKHRNKEQLKDYFKQLYGLLGGSRWVILVPDDWDSEWLETILRSAPISLSRKNVFLLWRSVAAALGSNQNSRSLNNKSLYVYDWYRNDSFNVIEIRYYRDVQTTRYLPQRASTRLHSKVYDENCTDVRFSLNCEDVHDIHKTMRSVDGEKVIVGAHVDSDDSLLIKGVKKFLKDQQDNLVSYYDERDGLYLVVQTPAEEVEFKTLVEHEECSPGGRLYRGEETKGASLLKGSNVISLYLLEGVCKENAKLKEFKEELSNKVDKNTDIFYKAEMIPGQGLANVTFKADFLEKPKAIDLSKSELSDYTKLKIEREMKRHFPPVMPYVEASNDIWGSVSSEVNWYLEFGFIPDTGLFAKPQPYFGVVGNRNNRKYGKSRYYNPETMSPIDLLKRENVFGNSSKYRTPQLLRNEDIWSQLFKKLANDYRNGKNVIRLIAWTYQYDNSEFEFIRGNLFKKYVNTGNLKREEYTFCANNFPERDFRITKLLEKALTLIKDNNFGEDDLRLAYNLMQFYPSALKDIESDLCEKALNLLFKKYKSHYKNLSKSSGSATMYVGYFLKCMLFILHRRRFDSMFFNQPEDWEPGFNLSYVIPNPGDSEARRTHEETRISLIKYIQGHGTIEGIPIGD